MPPGRPKKPDALKALEGNPGKRDLNRNMPVASGTLAPPEFLSEYAAQVWEQFVGSMPQQIYGACDTTVLAAFCEAAALHRLATTEMRGLDDPNEINRWATIQCKAASTITTTGAKLGCDPVSRSSLVMPQQQKEQGKFGTLIKIASKA